jgi:hypothetical protein
VLSCCSLDDFLLYREGAPSQRCTIVTRSCERCGYVASLVIVMLEAHEGSVFTIVALRLDLTAFFSCVVSSTCIQGFLQ